MTKELSSRCKKSYKLLVVIGEIIIPIRQNPRSRASNIRTPYLEALSL